MNQKDISGVRNHVIELTTDVCESGTINIEHEAATYRTLLNQLLQTADGPTLAAQLGRLEAQLMGGDFQTGESDGFNGPQSLSDIRRLKAIAEGGPMILAHAVHANNAAPTSTAKQAEWTPLPDSVDSEQGVITRRMLTGPKCIGIDPHLILYTDANGAQMAIIHDAPNDERQQILTRIQFATMNDALSAASKDEFLVSALWLLAENIGYEEALALIDAHAHLDEKHEALRESGDFTMSEYSAHIITLNGGTEKTTIASY
jgi:hypothetical protein